MSGRYPYMPEQKAGRPSNSFYVKKRVTKAIIKKMWTKYDIDSKILCTQAL